MTREEHLSSPGSPSGSSAAAGDPGSPEPSWLAGHIWRLAGAVLGLAALAGIVILALAEQHQYPGYSAAVGVIVVVVVGFVLIVLGGRMRS